MYLALDVLTIVCTGFMIGNELGVSLFMNPAVSQLDAEAQTKALGIMARTLGRVMPVWYGVGLILLIVEACVHHQSASGLLWTAAAIWAATIVYSLAALVPINNHIAALGTGSAFVNWKQEHDKWDKLHRWRNALLVAAMGFLVCGLLSA